MELSGRRINPPPKQHSDNPTENLTKTPQPQLTQQTATIESEAAGGTVDPVSKTTAEEVYRTPLTHIAQIGGNFQTPNTDNGIPTHLTSQVSEMESAIDQKMLSFENYTDTLSPIKGQEEEEEGEEVLSPDTQKLKTELQNTLDKSSWEQNISTVDEETEQSTVYSRRGRGNPPKHSD